MTYELNAGDIHTFSHSMSHIANIMFHISNIHIYTPFIKTTVFIV